MKTQQALARTVNGYTGVLNYSKYKNNISGWVLKDSKEIDINVLITAECAITNTSIDFEYTLNKKNINLHFKTNTIINLKFDNTTIFQIPLKTILKEEEYLTPSTLLKTSILPKKILLIGPCTIAAMRSAFGSKFKETKFEHYNANNFSKVVIKENEYDIKIITITPYQLLGMMNDTTTFLKQNFWEDKLNDTKQKLTLMLDNYIDDSGTLTLVTNYVLPQASPEISLQRGREIKRFLIQVNLFLEELVVKYKNTYVLDFDNIASSIGKRYCTGEHIHPPMLGKMFYSDGLRGQDRYPLWKAPERDRIDDYLCVNGIYENKLDIFYETAYTEIVSIFRINNQIDQVKMVVFDLDDTLIAGRIVDHYEMTNNEIPKRTSWNAGVWQAIQYLRGRGIIISIISKNDENIVKKWFPKISHSGIKYEDFVNPKINWKPKNENMAELLEETKLTPSGVVFVDDNPAERDNIKTYYPDIRVIGSSPYELKRTLCWSSETQVNKLSDEALNKKNLIEQTVRINKNLKSGELSRQDFILSLNLKIDIIRLKNTDEDTLISRCFELTNKTNQFNTTGERWKYEDFITFLNNINNKIFYFNVKDKNTNHGTVGVIYIQDNIIKQFLMSCRVIGLDVETVALEYIEKEIFKTYTSIKGVILETQNNIPCRLLFSNNNYIKHEQNLFIKNVKEK